GAHGADDLGEDGIGRALASEKQSRVVSSLVGDDAEAVELELVEPPLAIERHLRGGAKHRGELPAVHHARFGPELAGVDFETFRYLGAFVELVDGEALQDAPRP